MQERATLAGGCFWCTEAIFKRLKGVKHILPGYAGGAAENPSYEDVCSGQTGHAEAIDITFDPTAISYEKILEVFFATHDPTTLNRQGDDIGTQYRSAIFAHSDEQQKAAEAVIARLESEKRFSDPMVTEVVPFTNFYEAEDYHKNYFENNRTKPYCRVVIDPKVKKFLEQYRKDLKEETS